MKGCLEGAKGAVTPVPHPCGAAKSTIETKNHINITDAV